MRFPSTLFFRFGSPKWKLEGCSGGMQGLSFRTVHTGFFLFLENISNPCNSEGGSFVSRMKRRKPGVHPGSDHTISGNIYFDITNKPDRRVWLVCCSTEWGREGKVLLRFQQLADGIARRRWHGWGPAGGQSCWCGYRKHRHPCSR